MNIQAKDFFIWTNIFISVGQIPRNGIVELYDRWMFNFLTAYHDVFRSSYTILQSQQQWLNVLVLSHPF